MAVFNEVQGIPHGFNVVPATEIQNPWVTGRPVDAEQKNNSPGFHLLIHVCCEVLTHIESGFFSYLRIMQSCRMTCLVR